MVVPKTMAIERGGPTMPGVGQRASLNASRRATRTPKRPSSVRFFSCPRSAMKSPCSSALPTFSIRRSASSTRRSLKCTTRVGRSIPYCLSRGVKAGGRLQCHWWSGVFSGGRKLGLHGGARGILRRNCQGKGVASNLDSRRHRHFKRRLRPNRRGRATSSPARRNVSFLFWKSAGRGEVAGIREVLLESLDRALTRGWSMITLVAASKRATTISTN